VKMEAVWPSETSLYNDELNNLYSSNVIVIHLTG